MSQCEAILAHLLTGRTLTPMSAFELCGTLALHSRIAELRTRGEPIAMEMVKTHGGKRVGCYRHALVRQICLELV